VLEQDLLALLQSAARVGDEHLGACERLGGGLHLGAGGGQGLRVDIAEADFFELGREEIEDGLNGAGDGGHGPEHTFSSRQHKPNRSPGDAGKGGFAPRKTPSRSRICESFVNEGDWVGGAAYDGRMNYPPHPGAPQGMPPYPQQPYPQQQHQGWQNAAPPFGMARPPSRNVALIVVGSILLVIALAASIFFFKNLHQYLTIEESWGSDPALSGKNTEWIIELIKEAALKRMAIFGTVMGLFGVGGLVTGGLGLRKK
jgi:hypothetical protein